MRQAILRALCRGDPVSGEELARHAGVSRTAVWKHIAKLRREGYEISSLPGVGYYLKGSRDVLLPEDLVEVAGERWQIIFHRELPSTQEVARKLALEGAGEGTVVLAERQTSGRGRMGRSWSSPLGGVYLSIILRPRLAPPEALRLSLLAGVAVARTIRKVSGLKPYLKWPNDVLLGAKKVAGILCELGAETDRVNYVILGIGVNVNNDPPQELSEVATSLKRESGREIPRTEFIRVLLPELESLYRQLMEEGFKPIRQAWKELSSTLGSRVMVSSLGEVLQGEALDIDEDGALILRTSDGLRKVIAGDISLRPLR